MEVVIVRLSVFCANEWGARKIHVAHTTKNIITGGGK